MRKLLLTSSALVAAASISSYAVADVSVTGEFEWTYQQRAADLTAVDGDSFLTDNEVVLKFSNKTDSGLTVGGKMEMGNYDGTTSVIDESVLTISGGFGTFQLGQEDSAQEIFGLGEHDLIDEDANGAHSSASIVTTAGEGGSTDGNKITYITPNMGGFSAGFSKEDTGANTTTNKTGFGAKFVMPIDGGAIQINYNQATDDDTTDTDYVNYGAKLTMGAATLILAHGETEKSATTKDIEANGVGLSYNMGGGMKVGVSTMEAEDEAQKSAGVPESYSANIGEIVYTVAPGLDAKFTYTDYEYKAGGETKAANDSGQITQVTLSASF
jgi:hypothetical protein